MLSFEGKVAVVTGAANGIGHGIAKEICNRGGYVVLVDILADDLNAAVANLKANGKTAVAFEMDVTVEANWPALLDFTLKTFGKVDYLFNNAGIEYAKAYDEFNMIDWEYYFKSNVMSVVMGCNTFYPEMAKNGGGHICTTASTASLGPIPGTGIGAPYAPSKAACLMFMEQFAMEMAAKGNNITCSAVMPCVINTDIGLRIDNPLSFPVEYRDKIHLIDNRSPESKKAAHDIYDMLHLPKDNPIYQQLRAGGVIEVEEGVATILNDIERGYFYIYTHPGLSKSVTMQEMILRLLAYKQPISQTVPQEEYLKLSGLPY